MPIFVQNYCANAKQREFIHHSTFVDKHPGNVKVKIRRAAPEDAAAACAVLRRSIIELCYLDHQGDEQILAQWLANKTPGNLYAWLSSPHSQGFVAITCSQVVGVGLVGRSGEIHLCYILPEVLRSGVGKCLLEAMTHQVAEWGVKKVVLESTVTARPFYARNGFVRNGDPVFVYGITGYPMVKGLHSTRVEA